MLGRRARPAPTLVMLKGTTLPIADWEAMDLQAPSGAQPEALDVFWTEVALAWLEALRAALRKGFSVRESDCFLLLSSLDESSAKAALHYLEKARKRILSVLDGIAKESGFGKVCVLIFDNADQWLSWTRSHGARAYWDAIPAPERATVRTEVLRALGPMADASGRITQPTTVRYTLATRP